MDELRVRIETWLADETSNTAMLEVPMESAFTRLLAHSFIAHHYPTLYSHSSKREGGESRRVLCIYKNRSDLHKEQLESMKHESIKIDRGIGARIFFDIISSRRIPVIGHNCFYDLLHTYHSFYEDVPPHVEQFKAKWTSKFPKTFDTKILAECNEIIGGLQPPATLKSLCDFMAYQGGSHEPALDVQVKPLSPNFVYDLPSSVTGGSRTADFSHDAGYDAMMTSLVFLMQLRHIMERKSLGWNQIDFGRGSGNSSPIRVPITEVLRQSVNRIRLVKTQPSSINLAERQ
jgi:poly(A)-specific ribonuclease